MGFLFFLYKINTYAAAQTSYVYAKKKEKKVKIGMAESIFPEGFTQSLSFFLSGSLSVSVSLCLSLSESLGCKVGCQNISTLTAARPWWVTSNKVIHCLDPHLNTSAITSVIPVSSVLYERGFSMQNCVKTAITKCCNSLGLYRILQ